MAKKNKKTQPHQEQATPQTRAKLKRGTLDIMIGNGVISSVGAEMQAAEEIEKVYTYLVSEVAPKCGGLDRVDNGRRSELEPGWFIDAFKNRYKPWAARETLAARNVVISIAVHGRTAIDMDRAYRWRNGTARDVFLWGLRKYALYSGWVSGKQATTWNDLIDAHKLGKVG